MARKFNIGDTVEVVKNLGGVNNPLDKEFKVGHRGKVTEYDPVNKPHCYVVERKNKNIQRFDSRELKLIKRKTN